MKLLRGGVSLERLLVNGIGVGIETESGPDDTQISPTFVQINHCLTFWRRRCRRRRRNVVSGAKRS